MPHPSTPAPHTLPEWALPNLLPEVVHGQMPAAPGDAFRGDPMNAARTGHRRAHDRRRGALRRRLAGWSPAYPCDHCGVGTVWTRAYDKGCVEGTEHRCDQWGCVIFRLVK